MIPEARAERDSSTLHEGLIVEGCSASHHALRSVRSLSCELPLKGDADADALSGTSRTGLDSGAMYLLCSPHE